MNKVNTLFLGTPLFAAQILERIVRSPLINIVGVVTQEDKPAGREQKIKPSLVKYFAQTRKLPLSQPVNLAGEASQILSVTKPDLIIVASYGQMIPKIMLDYPKYKCINVHGSLLPHLRGAVPVPMAILEGLEETGVTIVLMEEKLDAGPVLSQQKIKIESNDTSETLMNKMAGIGGNLLVFTIEKWTGGSIIPFPQNEKEATYCFRKDITKEKAIINWNDDINKIERSIRAFYPWPVAWTEIDLNGQKKRLKVFRGEISRMDYQNIEIGTIFSIKNQLFIKCTNGTLLISELQLEGKKRGLSSDYLYLASKKF